MSDFKRTSEAKWPLGENGRWLQVSHINHPSIGLGACNCCDDEATFQIVMYKAIREGDKAKTKTSLFVCETHAHFFAMQSRLEANKKCGLWDEGWEISCDFCTKSSDERPNAYSYTHKYNEGELVCANTLCEDCRELEALFA